MSATETPPTTFSSSSVAELLAAGFPPAVAAALASLQAESDERAAWATAFGGITFGGVIAPAVAGSLVVAQRAARAVAKTAEGMAYKYTKMEDLLEEGRGALNGAGLALIPGSLLVTRFAVGERGTMNYTYWRAWCLVHESGASHWMLVSWPLYLQSGKRSRDKAVAVADTTSLGYLYRDLLAIPRLGEDQMDARDDRGTTEPGIDPSEPGPLAKKPRPKPPAPSSSKPAAPAKPKPAAKPKPSSSKPKPPTAAEKKKAADEKVAASKKRKADQAKERRAAKKKAAAKPAAKVNDADRKAEAAEAAAEDKAEREAIEAEGNETAKPGPKPAGKTYGDGDQDAIDKAVREALAMGLTPRTTNASIIVELPGDPTAAELEDAGWPAELAEELEGYQDDGPVKRDALNTVTRKAADLMGLSFKQAKPMLVPAFSGVGVELKKNQTPNGYQLRLWCVAVGGIAAAHEASA